MSMATRDLALGLAEDSANALEPHARDDHGTPALILTGYPPFRAMRALLNQRYLPVRRMPGLWIRREDRERFEAAESEPLRPRSAAGTPRDQPAGSSQRTRRE